MKISILGGTGAFGTAIGHLLTQSQENEVILIGRDKEIIKAINESKVNFKKFPYVKLNRNLKATDQLDNVKNSDIIFISLPSKVIPNFFKKHKEFFTKKNLLINLSKGFGENAETIPETIKKILKKEVEIISLKGPTFATELIHNYPSGITIGFEKTEKNYVKLVKNLFKNSNLFFDSTTDILGVELAGVLKNIYAIAVGIFDAYFNSANTRFLILTQAFKEFKEIMLFFGAKEETLFKYCAFGDLTLTSLNDLSRNRTLGLMIGKGFLSPHIQSSVILEGKRALKILFEKIKNNEKLFIFPIISNLYKVFYENLETKKFITNILNSLR